MGKTGKWLRSFLGNGKKEKDGKEKETQSQALVPCQSVSSSSSSKSQTPKEKRRWSFRRSVHKDSNSKDSVPTAAVATTTTTTNSVSGMPLAENEEEQRKHAIDVAAATAEAADATIAAAQAAAAVISLAFNPHKPTPTEEMAALKIQSAFRSHLAKKALRALKGLVKLQALVRGHLVRKQAAATLRCMQALVTVQARARAQRILAVVAAESSSPISRRLSVHGRSLHEHHQRFGHSYDMDRGGTDDNIKIVEMDIGEARGISRGKMSNVDRSEQIFWVNRRSLPPLPKIDRPQSPAPSTGRTETIPKACSSHFDEFSLGTTQSSPQYFSAMSRPYSSRGYRIEYAESVCNDYSSFPNYMANTESSRAKARSQSAPKQRPDSYERTPSRRRATMESRSVPQGYRMQRSSSQVGSTRKGYQYQHPASIRLDRSAMSLQDSECGSTCSVLTNTNYARPLVGIEAYGNGN